jgi:hypothetical protein
VTGQQQPILIGLAVLVGYALAGTRGAVAGGVGGYLLTGGVGATSGQPSQAALPRPFWPTAPQLSPADDAGL